MLALASRTNDRLNGTKRDWSFLLTLVFFGKKTYQQITDRQADLRWDFTYTVNQRCCWKLTGSLRVKQLITRPLLSVRSHTYSAVERSRHVRAITSSDRFLENDLTWSLDETTARKNVCLSRSNGTMSRCTEMTLFQRACAHVIYR